MSSLRSSSSQSKFQKALERKNEMHGENFQPSSDFSSFEHSSKASSIKPDQEFDLNKVKDSKISPFSKFRKDQSSIKLYPESNHDSNNEKSKNQPFSIEFSQSKQNFSGSEKELNEESNSGLKPDFRKKRPPFMMRENTQKKL